MTPYLGEIRMFAGTFAPTGWAFCNGQVLPITEHDALFTLIGTTYGGDGQETFALPDLRARSPRHSVNDSISTMQGLESVTLTMQQIPVHSHALLAADAGATALDPASNVTAEAVKRYYGALPSSPGSMNSGAIAPAGGSQPHENMQPFLTINFIISLFGDFPTPT